MPIEDFIIHIYCYIVEEYQEIIKDIEPFRKRGYAPKLTDAEVITMEVLGEFLGIDTDKGIWEYFRRHWRNWFPQIGSRTSFARQASALWSIKQQLLGRVTERLSATLETIHIVDGFPMPVCKFARAKHCAPFKGTAEYGYCAAKKQTYYGFKGQVLIGASGAITDFTIVPANVDERESLWDLTHTIQGILIGDKGYISKSLKEQLVTQGIDLQTPLRSNMPESRPPSVVRQLISTRRLVETVIGQLTERFNIQKVWARDGWHLANRVTRKFLSHSLAVLLNRFLGRDGLLFDGLIL